MKILVVIPDRMVGGGQLLALQLARRLAQAHRVSIIYAYPEEAASEPPKVPERVTLVDSAPGHIRHYFPAWLWFLFESLDFLLPPWHLARETGFLLRTVNRLYQRVRRRRFLEVVGRDDFDVVNSHAWRSDQFVGECLPADWATPWVLTMHGCYEQLLADLDRHPEYERQMRKVLNRVDQVLYIADKNLKALNQLKGISLRAPPRKVGNGIEISSAAAQADCSFIAPDADLRLVLVSRAIREKGWEEAIEAVLQINRETDYSIHLTLVGESDYQQELSRKCSDPNIRFSGYSPDPTAIIAGCDVGLLPSFFAPESVPLSVLEYLSCGKPVIATDVGEIADMITHGGRQAGQVIPIAESGVADVDSLKRAILRYLAEPDRLAAESALAREAAAKFSMDNVVASYVTLFEQTIAKKRFGEAPEAPASHVGAETDSNGAGQ